MTAEVQAFFERHAAAQPYLQAARQELELGVGQVEVRADADRMELLQTYRIRAKHLATYASEHARRLCAEAKALVVALDDLEGDRVRVWSFSGSEGVSIVAFECAQTDVLLGCLKSYSKLRVTPERWREIWGLREGEYEP